VRGARRLAAELHDPPLGGCARTFDVFSRPPCCRMQRQVRHGCIVLPCHLLTVLSPPALLFLPLPLSHLGCGRASPGSPTSGPGEAVGTEQLAAQLSEITSRLERLQQTLEPGGSAEARTTLS